MKFRKKPVVIDAIQWFPGKSDVRGVLTRPTGRELRGMDEYEHFVRTLEGDMRVSPGDWIITGVKGEKHPCKPDIFDATYDPVEVLA